MATLALPRPLGRNYGADEELRPWSAAVELARAGVGIPALSLGERVASVASQVRGHLVVPVRRMPPPRPSDPSPGPRRLVKAPVAVHPLPLGEGGGPISPVSPLKSRRSEKPHGRVERKTWNTLRTRHRLQRKQVVIAQA
jgi:hypothetical protein